MKLGDPLDCSGYELRNALFHLLASAPSSPKEGAVWYLTGNHVPYYHNGTNARPLDAGALTDQSIQNSALQTNPLLRSNHQGTQPAATISDLASVVKGYSLDQFAAAAAAVNFGSQRATNIAQATNGTDAARWDQVQAFVAAAIQGRVAIKDPVRIYITTASFSLSGLGPYDGVTLIDGDRVAVSNNSGANAIYNAHAGAWTLAPDSTTGSQWAEGTEFLVNEGSYNGAIFRQTATGSLTIGTNTNPLAFTQAFKINAYAGDNTTVTLTGQVFSVHYDAATMTTSSGALGVRTDVFVRKYSATVTTDGSASSFNIAHGLGTTDIIVGVRDSSNGKVWLDDAPVNATTASISFGAPPAANQTYRVTIFG